MAKDFLGYDLNIHDEVVFVEPGYRNLLKGKLISISDKMALIEHNKLITKDKPGENTTRQFHSQIIKIKQCNCSNCNC